jgi:hypothetical protein
MPAAFGHSVSGQCVVARDYLDADTGALTFIDGRGNFGAK